ncbi:unnamed protein product [Notodromas monacha]|uniref:Uncharacterized protein n=1 Tax=Notodromas monacha TaxID=399045 RepID=A0A7R9BPM5_9CRUS|nr:unnamed protein product [Notodromas monacha]CAG0918481.1 unnamed protein product [Notodromas monacha]
MDGEDLISFDNDVPTGMLIDVSPLKPSTWASKQKKNNMMKMPSYSTILKSDDDDAFMNVEAPAMDETPPDSPAKTDNCASGRAVGDFSVIAEESKNIVAWMKEAEVFSFGDKVKCNPAAYHSITRNPIPATAPNLADVVKRYRRISSSLSTPDAQAQKNEGNDVDSKPPSSTSSLRQRHSVVHDHTGSMRKTVKFADSSPEANKRDLMPKVLKLNPLPSHNKENRPEGKPIARVGPLKAVRPVAAMVRPSPLAGKPVASVKPMAESSSGVVRPPVVKSAVPTSGNEKPSSGVGKRVSYSLDRLTAGVKGLRTASPARKPVLRKPAGSDPKAQPPLGRPSRSILRANNK